VRKKGNKIKISREWIVYIGTFVVFLLVIGKLFLLQVVNADELKAKGTEMESSIHETIIERGTIYDAQNNILAKSVETKDIYADTKNMNQLLLKNKKGLTKDSIAKQLSGLIGKSSDEIMLQLNKDAYSICLARQIDVDTAQKIKDLNLPGINLMDSLKRVYPMSTSAASVLGIVNAAGHGVEGVELSYDQELLGVSDSAQPSQSTEQLPGQTNIDEPIKGNNIVLTLDSTVQHLI
jgi:cell division protein FtsI/penicillin-binding protein 2